MNPSAQYDEIELLAYIEDELDADAARLLRQRLANDPDVLRQVEGMRRDCAMLRTEPEAAMPDDLAERLEQALTRPMLLAAWGEDEPADSTHLLPRTPGAGKPGEFRRRHNLPARRRRVFRMAMAASIGLIVLGGSWLGVSAGLRSFNDWRGQRMLIAHSERASENDQTARALRSDISNLTSQIAHSNEATDVHIALPDSDAVSGAMAFPSRGMRIAASPPPGAVTSADGEPIAVDFALVIHSVDHALAEKGIEQLAAARGRGGDQIALVQNFSLEEAMQLERLWLTNVRQPQRERTVHAGTVDRGTIAPPREVRLRETARRSLLQARSEQGFEMSRQLAGPRDLAASYRRQLDYSGRGATHTVTIRLSQLQEFLEEMDRAQLPGITQFALEPLPDSEAGEQDETTGAGWARARAVVRQALTQLDSIEGDPLIDLPIIIE